MYLLCVLEKRFITVHIQRQWMYRAIASKWVLPSLTGPQMDCPYVGYEIHEILTIHFIERIKEESRNLYGNLV